MSYAKPLLMYDQKKKLNLKKKSYLGKFLYWFYIKTFILLTMVKILMLFYGIAGT